MEGGLEGTRELGKRGENKRVARGSIYELDEVKSWLGEADLGKARAPAMAASRVCGARFHAGLHGMMGRMEKESGGGGGDSGCGNGGDVGSCGAGLAAMVVTRPEEEDIPDK
ncbi:hypothetical protein E2562_010333 [Oryza meyeriana var. granulata]|uniref:DUF834 domain-containing protein n=1 Tax=Oryza meyeriana var. granulata TaxID=110450 RepID=A0A6G1F666_9ORYZ|nr:hypothetical protein E2562_010333 [Oryza meyeriana var. granulata]